MKTKKINLSHLRQAYDMARAFHDSNGMELCVVKGKEYLYSQSSWEMKEEDCGTTCCLHGLAWHIAGNEEPADCPDYTDYCEDDFSLQDYGYLLHKIFLQAKDQDLALLRLDKFLTERED